MSLPASKIHSFLEQENEKEESFGTQVKFDFSLTASEFAKSPMLYEVRLLCYYRENTK
jgi:hypothetical protein